MELNFKNSIDTRAKLNDLYFIASSEKRNKKLIPDNLKALELNVNFYLSSYDVFASLLLVSLIFKNYY